MSDPISLTRMGRVFLLITVLVGLLLAAPLSQPVLAANGDFSLDFIASDPATYNHVTGGGAYDDRTIGVDVRESLEGSDFNCGDVVTYLLAITVDNTQSAIDDQPQTLELDFSFLADTTGQPGAALGDVTFVGINYSPIEDLLEDNVEDGITDDGGSTATVLDEFLTGPLYTAGSTLELRVQVDDLEAGEQVVLRVDVMLMCQLGASPTGNLQASLEAARLTYINGTTPVDPPEAVPGGAQTVPFKKIAELGYPDVAIVKTVTTAGGTCPGVDSLTVNEGDMVKYCYEVTNPGTAPLYNVTLVDDNATPGVPGDDFTVPLVGLTDMDGDGNADDLDAGAIATGEALVPIAGPGTFNNIGTVTGDDGASPPVQMSSQDDAIVTVTDLPSSIDVVKTADPTSVDEPGGSVVYTVDVENTSAVDIVTIDSVIDDIYGNVCDAANPLIISTTCSLPQILNPGDIYSFTFEAMVMGNANDVITDVVTASGVDDDGVPVSDYDDATVTINDITLARPIVVTKTADPIEVNAPGGDVTYTVTIENVSAVDTMFINSLIDDVYGDLNGKGDCAIPVTIPPLGSYTCSFTEPVSGSGGDVIHDTVTASGEDDDGNPVSDFDDATVTIIGVFQGCTPGYWKQEQHFDSWGPTGYAPGDPVGNVFTAAPGDLAGDSLVDALDYPGGPGALGAARILLRAAVAALLNATHPDLNYEISDPDEVKTRVNDALAGDRKTMLDLAKELDEYNKAGCFDDMEEEEEPEIQPEETSSPAPQAPGIKTALGRANPNPFNPDTWIPFKLAADANVEIEIYDVTGRLVRRLDLGYRPAGSYWDRSKSAYWDGRNEAGESVASGIYFYKMTAGDFTAIRRMVILK